MKISVSFLKSDDYKKCITKINKTSADFIHVDVCDGKYVEEKNFTPKLLLDTLSVAEKKLDIHLMTNNPITYVDELSLLNIETITFHLDSTSEPLKMINYVKEMGIKVGVAINPTEDIDMLKPYLDKIDEVLVMSVTPGKGGQQFMMESLTKIEELVKIKNNYHFIVAVDGGVNIETINYLKPYNVDMVICGSYITQSDNFEEAIQSLQK